MEAGQTTTTFRAADRSLRGFRTVMAMAVWNAMEVGDVDAVALQVQPAIFF